MKLPLDLARFPIAAVVDLELTVVRNGHPLSARRVIGPVVCIDLVFDDTVGWDFIDGRFKQSGLA